MPDSLYSSLLNTLDRNSIGSVAGALGERDNSVFRFLELAVTSIFGKLANKAGDTGFLRRIMDLAPSAGNTTFSGLGGEVSKTTSPLLAEGKRVVSGLFGNSDAAVTNWISRESGVQSGVGSSLMSMAALTVMGFLGKRMRAGMGTADLARSLQQDGPAIKAALPAELNDIMYAPAATTETAYATPVVAQAVRREAGTPAWMPLLAILGACLLGLFWFLGHWRRPPVTVVVPHVVVPHVNIPVPTPKQTTGEANREAPPAVIVPNVVVKFRTGSAALSPESRQELRKLAAGLKANPDVHMAVNGYTDSVGKADTNQRLSQARSDSVKAELVRDGVSADRLTQHAYADQNAVGDNSSAGGRQQNRRVSVEQQTE